MNNTVLNFLKQDFKFEPCNYRKKNTVERGDYVKNIQQKQFSMKICKSQNLPIVRILKEIIYISKIIPKVN